METQEVRGHLEYLLVVIDHLPRLLSREQLADEEKCPWYLVNKLWLYCKDIPNFINANFGGGKGYQKTKNTGGEDQLISKGTPDGKPLSQGFNLLDKTRKDLGTKKEKK